MPAAILSNNTKTFKASSKEVVMFPHAALLNVFVAS